MTRIEFDFEFEGSAWDVTRDTLRSGGSISATRFLTLMESEDEDAVLDALQDLQNRRIRLDISDLPKLSGEGETAVRLRREQQLVQQGVLLSALDENDPLRLYLEELASIPVCGDEAILAHEAEEGKNSAAEQLLNLSLSRVVELAKEHAGCGVLLLDLIQEGSLGAWQAIACYESGDFAEHRDWFIRQAMAQAITLQARASGVGQKMRQFLEDYRSVDERLLSELGRNATVEEIAVEMHITPEEAEMVRDTLDSARLLSQARAANAPKEETPEEEEAHVEDTALFQMRQRIAELLEDVSETDAKLLSLRFGLEGGLPMSPEEIGRKLGLTPEEVIAREAAALAQLRKS